MGKMVNIVFGCPPGESQDVTNKSCSICPRDDPWGPGAPEPRMYPRSGYFLVYNKIKVHIQNNIRSV